ncbi:uncharacterized protein EI97DRAFT_439010 [Westerdykella ornata]|uniref:Uncharacterized protein n=1 Tax=Westerdykella ornata TaxID=318751 RepID=A0A6A6JTH3_WESOR|nr:uncharacterized protein EI97DRAFT_439010 [Westerdykella ornata]KAF2279911.1 hypothetical protein EI97DRAFT_439010 [Westerdykella ornata]
MSILRPPYFFRIHEIRERSDIRPHADSRGHWIPCSDPGAHVRVQVGASGKYYFCNGQQIYEVTQLPQGCAKYKTFSMYYAGGQGFLVLRGDARKPRPDETWQPLQFDHDENDYSSFLTNAGEQQILRVQRPDQQWPMLLLPDIYHTSTRTQARHYGGIKGELPIFLALIAFSTLAEYLPNVLPLVFTGGAWQVHQYRYPRTMSRDIPTQFMLIHSGTNRRGVVVTVYTCPENLHGGSTEEDLEDYEHGLYGKYFD